jgi:hypothetical protein
MGRIRRGPAAQCARGLAQLGPGLRSVRAAPARACATAAPLCRQLDGAAERRSGWGQGRGLTGAEEGGPAELTGEDGGDWQRRSTAGRRRRWFRTAATRDFRPWQRRSARNSGEAGEASDRHVGAGARGGRHRDGWQPGGRMVLTGGPSVERGRLTGGTK